MLVREEIPPDRLRAASVATGVLLIVATATNVVGSALSSPPLGRPIDFASVSSNASRVDAGLLLQFIAAGASVGIALAMYPVLRPWGRGLSLGSVAFRAIEAVLYVVAIVSALALVDLGQRFEAGITTHRTSFLAVGGSLLDVRDQANLAAVMAFCVGACMYYWLLYRSQLVPRWLSGWGILAIALLSVACLLALFGHRPVTTYVLLALPIAAQEIVLAVWLLTKGFGLRDGTATGSTGGRARIGATPGSPVGGRV